MLTEWDRVHADYSPHPTTRPTPRGLAATEHDWRQHLAHDTPGGWLLHSSSMLQTLASGQRIYLMHTTPVLDAIRDSGQLYQAAGCLVGSLYCAPLFPEPDGLRPHNLGSYLLQTKQDRQPLIFEITPSAPTPLKGLDYLHLGRIHLRTYQDHQSFLTDTEHAWLQQAAVQRVQAAAPVLDLLLTNARRPTTAAGQFIDRLAAAIPALPFLGYLYFEVLSEYLMLHSTSRETKALAESGELNNLPPKRLAFNAVTSMDRLFDLALFQPGHAALLELIEHIEPGLAAGAAAYTRDRLSHLFTCIALDPTTDAGAVTFQQVTDFPALAALSPGLAGQLIFRQLRTSPRYPQLFPVFEQAKALGACGYWNTTGIATPFNGTIPKGEIGINLSYPHCGYRAWTADISPNGMLHAVDELDVTFIPRLTDLRYTALGYAHFTRQPAPLPAQAS
ncbi:hypothetical protein [Streptacidiphilus anmyonensis]|uniref:hypothetical protein n=1 Tax=Streptacidiphilus anmyonensis TaxID=405782 RepID=UPI0005A907C5|nr:hypothetical protein [Streptacidiphilus anmyonensis]